MAEMDQLPPVPATLVMPPESPVCTPKVSPNRGREKRPVSTTETPRSIKRKSKQSTVNVPAQLSVVPPPNRVANYILLRGVLDMERKLVDHLYSNAVGKLYAQS